MERPHKKKTDFLNKKDSSRLTPYGSRNTSYSSRLTLYASRFTLNASRGFTLIEIIMVIVLLGIVGSVASMIIFQGSKSYSEEEIRKDLMTQGRLAVERMAREIRLVKCTKAGSACNPSATDITNWSSTELRFLDINYQGKGFRYDSGASALTLCRSQSACSGNEDILADNVSSLTFTYLKNDGTTSAAAVGEIWIIKAALTLSRGAQSTSFLIEVHPRAFK